MREIKFRVWIYDNLNKCGAMYYAKDFGDSEAKLLSFFENKCIEGEDFLMQSTGLKDSRGVEIYEGDRIRFLKQAGNESGYCQNIWDGTVTIEDGVPTVSILDATQVENEKDWNRKHDWIKSRSWACQVGYGEFGTWNVPRKPLTQIQSGFAEYEKHYKPICKKHGYGNRYLNVEVIGNRFENPELIGGTK